MDRADRWARHKKWLIIIAQIYSGFILCWLLLRAVFSDAYWPLAMVNTAVFYCFVPLLFLWIPVLASRDRRAIMALMIPVIVFLFFWGALFLPAPSSAHSSQPLKMMTFNVLVSNKAGVELTNSITSAVPDVIGFQELSPTTIQALQTQLSTEYPHHTFDQFEPHGVGLMSRFPITAVTRVPFPPRDLALHAIIDWHGEPVHVLVAHLSANNIFDNSLAVLPQLAHDRYAQRADQVSRLLAELALIDEPVVLLCDCNFTDTSEAYGRLRTQLHDSFKQAGWGFGHTLHTQIVPFRVQRVDYIWTSPHFAALDSTVGQNGGSDHHPVISTLSLQEKNS